MAKPEAHTGESLKRQVDLIKIFVDRYVTFLKTFSTPI